jgi:trans-aconitate 2-methyltransferase
MTSHSADGWAPEVYARFASHRAAPFDDLLRLLSPARRGTLLDLGCGTGTLTAKAHVALQVSTSLGLDSSAAMLGSGALADGVTLERRDIATSLPGERFDRVLSNSAFNWIPEHRVYLPRVLSLVAPGGELAVQMPSNPDSPFSQCVLEVAAQFTSQLGGYSYRSPVETPEVYAELLARDQRVMESKVGTWYYPQLHESVAGIVAFAQGGLLSAYRARLESADFERFCAAYRDALEKRLGSGPVFFAFRRVFLFAKLKP